MSRIILSLCILLALSACGEKKTSLQVKEYVDRTEEFITEADKVTSPKELKKYSMNTTKFMFDWAIENASREYSEEEIKMIDEATNKLNLKLLELNQKYPIEYNTDTAYDEEKHGKLPIEAFRTLIQNITEQLDSASTNEDLTQAQGDYVWGMDSIFRTFPKEAMILVYEDEDVLSDSKKMNMAAQNAEKRANDFHYIMKKVLKDK